MTRHLILFLIFTFATFFPQNRTRSFIPKRVNENVVRQTQLLKWQEFNTANKVCWNIRWNKYSGAPASIFGEAVFIGKGDAVEVAKTFLKFNTELFKLSADLKDLKLIKNDERRNRHISFQQTYKDLPVYGALLSLHLTKENKVYYVMSDYYCDVQLTNTTPSINMTAASDVALNDLGLHSEKIKIMGRKLIILPYGDEFRLAWEIEVITKTDGWQYLISAENKEIFAVYDLNSHYVTGNGDVYDRHPAAGAIVNRTLTNLSGSGYQLNGKHVIVINDGSSNAYETDLSFNYTTSSTHFDEVMAYYHTNIFFENYLSSLDYIHSGQIEMHVHATNSGPHTNPGGKIYFPDGDGVIYNNFVEEDVIIYHEILHCVMQDITAFQNGGHDPESYSLIEAFADYFGCSKANTPNQGEYAKISGIERTLSNSYTMSNFSSLVGDNYNYHAASQILSGAFWDIRSNLGSDIADKIIFEGLDNIDQFVPSFIDVCEAILAADISIYNSAHVATILTVFSSRGILDVERA